MQELIVQEARTWLGTKFSLYGRRKKSSYDSGACDCIGLIFGISKNLKAKSITGEFDIGFFDHFQYNLRNSTPLMEIFLNTHFKTTTRLEIGNIALLQISINQQHVGIIVNYYEQKLGIIHADLKSRRIVEHYLTEEWKKKIINLYNFL